MHVEFKTGLLYQEYGDVECEHIRTTSARLLQHFKRKESKSSAHEEDIFYCSYIHVILSFETTIFAFQQLAHSRNQLSNVGSGERASCGG